MGAMKRLAKFTGGSVIGAAVGAVTASVFAPESGNDLQHRIRNHFRRAKIAGAVAKAEKQEELIRRFQGSVGDPDALEDERKRVQAEVAEAVQSVGLGLNAPGAIAAQETVTRR